MSVVHVFNTTFQSVVSRAFGSPNRRWVNRTLQNWSKRTLKLVRVKCQIINPHHTQPQKGQPTIIMCNHSSLYDIPISLRVFPKHSVRMLAKKELSKIPILGTGMKAGEFPFIDRKNRRQALQDLQRVKNLLACGIVMWIAPEGTRSKDGKLAHFKKGGFITAIQAKATIIPIGIRGAQHILPAKTLEFYLNQSVEVHVGKPIDASQYSLENKEKLIEIVYQEMKKLVGQESSS